ncbi:MAG: hypothetical protein NTW03_07295, partial [Verrucomicrobia bacterium]|nr:hypothetical protein [Verrucomicrobiota bacterium]
MKTKRAFVILKVLLGVLATPFLISVSISQPAAPAPIAKVDIRDRAFYINGQPFFPLMAWLQDARNLRQVKECGMNATAGYWGGAGGAENVAEYMTVVAKTGLYGVMPFHKALKGNPSVLGYIHDDEPDLSHQVSDARVEADPALHVNPKNPLWRLLDGDLNSWTVLDPMENASLTIHLPKPVTVERLGVAVTVSKGLALPTEIIFTAEGKQLLKAKLTGAKGLQKFDLPQPATFKDLALKVTAVTPGDQPWGSLGEIAGFDHAGTNVMFCPPRREPRAYPEKSLAQYRIIKAADPARPVFMTLTAEFLPFFKKWTEPQYAMYPEYIKATDVVGYDIYPIYGWNKPEWIYLGHDATAALTKLAGS